MTDKSDLAIDQLLALRTSAGRLQERFSGVFSTETIERFLYHSYDEFATRAAVVQWLPLLAERFAVQRLTALARVEGRSDDHRPIVLFLCVHNAGRSQMAAAYLVHLSAGQIEVRSAGSAPAAEVNPSAVAAMAEEGIDMSAEIPKVLTNQAVQASDVVITMGCGDTCPLYPGKRYEDWVLEDPAGKGVESVRPIRDEIRRRVAELIEQLLPAAD